MNYRKPTLHKLLLAALFMLLCATGAPRAASQDLPRSFSLSTSRTFAPGESVKIELYAKNVPELEFRVYKVRNAEKFFSSLKDVHSFGVKNYSPSEQIDQRTLLERLHDLKAHLWWLVRSFFRGQFTDDARDSFRESQGKLGKRSRVVGVSQFARIPLLNESQLVARWKLETPPAIVSQTQQLPIDGLDAGQYGRHFTFLKFRSMRVNNDQNLHKEYVTKFIARRRQAAIGWERCGRLQAYERPEGHASGEVSA